MSQHDEQELRRIFEARAHKARKAGGIAILVWLVAALVLLALLLLGVLKQSLPRLVILATVTGAPLLIYEGLVWKCRCPRCDAGIKPWGENDSCSKCGL